MKKKKYYIEQLDSNDCGAACLAMICKYYKKDFSITKLRDILGTDINGTPINGLHHGAEELGFIAKKIRITQDVIHDKFTLPAICHVRTDDGASHFVVLAKVSKKCVTLLDPAKGILKEKIEDFFTFFDGIILLMFPGETFYKNVSEKKSVMKNYLQILTPQKNLFICAIISSLFLTGLGIFFSLFNKVLMDEILPYGLKNLLIAYTIGFGCVLFARVLLGAIRQHLVLYLSQRIDLPLMLGYFTHIFKLPIDFFAKRKIGDVTTRFQDAFTIKEILTNTALTLIIDIVLAIVTMIVLIVMSPRLFLILLIVTILSIILIYAYKGIYKKLNKRQMEQSARLNSSIIEGLKGIETIKANSYEDATMDKIENEYVSSLKTSFEQGFHSNIQGSLSSFVSGIGNLLMMAFGVFYVINGNITIGTVLAFFTISGYFLDPIGRLINMQLSIQEANISLKRLGEIYDVDEEEMNEKNTQNIEQVNSINVKNIVFRYGKRSPVLQNINLNINKGMKVAIVGESGSGKTTLGKLLLKFYLPEEGEILIDGIDLKNINAFSLRKVIGYVPQNVELFSGSILDNMRVAKEDATFNEIKNACEIAGCSKFINRLPFGYETFLDDNGGGLSGGEKQRLALARALLKKPQFIILDEATSNLDMQTENEVLDLLFNRQKDKTMLIIAHRLSTIKNCDLIIVMDNGTIAESGTHDALMSNSVLYKKFWDLQTGKVQIKNDDIESVNKIEEDDFIEYK